MKANTIVFAAVVLLPFSKVIGQNVIVSDTSNRKEIQISIPQTPTEYRITKYKNIDFYKTNPMQLESAGLHTEIYISNTNRGVIIISSTEYDKALKDFSHTLDLNPGYYETITRQDTTIFLSGNNKNATFDFTKVSSINHEYKNAFNYSVDPRTGVSWSKGNYEEINVKGGYGGYGQLLYDLIIWAPKIIK